MKPARHLALGSALVSLVAVLAAALLGISVEHGDQIAEVGVVKLAPGVGWLTGAVVAITVVVVAVTARRGWSKWIAAATAGVSLLVVVVVRRWVDSEASGTPLGQDTSGAETSFTATFAGPFTAVDVATNQLLLAVAALGLVATIVFTVLRRTETVPDDRR